MRRVKTSFPGPHRKKYLNNMAAVLCALTEVAAFECWIFKMNRTKSKTMNRRALIGKLRFWWWGTFPSRTSHGFMSKSLLNIYWRCSRSSWNSNLSRVEGSNVFQEFEEASQKAISTKDNIYCLSAPWHGSVSTFELTRKFVSCYFFGMTVKFLEEIAVTKVNCKHRFHPDTGKL